MRPVQLADIEMAARVLLRVPLEKRCAAMAHLREHAEIAERSRRRSGKLHPDYGNGTLMSAATRFGAASRLEFCNEEFLSCLLLVITELLKTRTDHKA